MQNGPIGEILVGAGLLQEIDAARYERAALHSHRSLREVLVDSEVLSELEIVQAMANQLAIPWVTLRRVEFSRELLNCIDARTALRYRVLPVYKRRLKEGETLFVAMEDPTDTLAKEAVEWSAQRPVRPMIAPSSEITEALAVYYGASLPLPVDENAITSEVLLDDPVVDLTEYSGDAVAQAGKERPRMRTFILLDGTEIRLPAKMIEGHGNSTPESPSPALTASDVAKALRAQSQGIDMSEVLGDGNTESVVGALLTLLVRKGLIADWEFIDTWAKWNTSNRKKSESFL